MCMRSRLSAFVFVVVCALAPGRLIAGTIVWNGDDIGTQAAGWTAPEMEPDAQSALVAEPGAGTDGSVGLKWYVQGTGWAGFGWNWSGWGWPDAGTDISHMTHLVFKVKFEAPTADGFPAPEAFAVRLASAPGGGQGADALPLSRYVENMLDGQWHDVAIPLADLHALEAGPEFDPKSAWELQLGEWSQDGKDFTVCLDDIWFDVIKAQEGTGREAMPAHRAAEAAPSPESRLVGFILVNGPLRARVTDNAVRLVPIGDYVMPGYNGLASLIHERQGRNIFDPVGLNYECGSTVPQMGQQRAAWNAPRVAPMAAQQLDAHTVRLTQKGADAAGLNAEIIFSLGETYVDQTITVWPDVDVESSSTFWASYMDLVQNTSLYLRGVLQREQEARWLEMTSAGHDGGTFFRPFDPGGKAWHEFLTDNPVMRQAIKQTPESVAATVRAGFREGKLAASDNFFFGFVDDYVALWIFRPTDEGAFNPWGSASGSEAVRRPAWDFGIWSGPQKAGERRTYHVRLVYKPFAGLDDVLREVQRFQHPEAE